MDWDLQNIFAYPPIMGVTINAVFLSPAFRSLLYVLMALVLAVATTYFLGKHVPFVDAVRRSALITFFISGLVYAMHNDIGWAGWIMQDYQKFSGVSTDEKLIRMEGQLYDFALRAGKVIEGNYYITNHSPENYEASRLEYFLLPHRRAEDARYIIVLLDKQARWDSGKKTLTTPTRVFEKVEPVLLYANNAYILKRL